MFIQFDGEIEDEAQLLSAIRAAGIPARSVRISRWIRTDAFTLEEFDAGGRIDIELPHAPRQTLAPQIDALEVFMEGYLK